MVGRMSVLESEMKILVTGSEGFLGKHLCKYLTNIGHQVVAADKKNGIDLGNKDTVMALPISAWVKM